MIRLFGKHRKQKFDKAKHPISFAFECGGIKYYQFDDPLNTPYKRGFTALTFYREMRMHCTLEFLTKHVAAIEKIISNPASIHIGKIAILTNQLKERLEFVFEPETAYKFASVVYFDESEDPTLYDFKQGQKKIAHWKKHASVHDFFLQQPLIRLIPFLMDFDGDLNSYSNTVELIKKYHLEKVSEVLSTMKLSNESGKKSTSFAGFPQE